MADLSGLGNLVTVDPLSLGDSYPEARRSTFQLAPKGTYTVQAPDSFPTEAFGASQAGYLTAQIDPTIVDGPHAGFQLKYQRVSAKPFQRKGETASIAGDYLIACGFRGNLNSPQDIADAIEATAGTTYEVKLDWRAENYQTKFKVEGMENFPRNADGTYQSWVEDPTSTNPDGTPKRLMARLFIREFIPARG